MGKEVWVGIPKTRILVLVPVVPLIGYVTVSMSPQLLGPQFPQAPGTPAPLPPGRHTAMSDRWPECLLSKPCSGSQDSTVVPMLPLPLGLEHSGCLGTLYSEPRSQQR